MAKTTNLCYLTTTRQQLTLTSEFNVVWAYFFGLVSIRQVLRLTWKVRRENEPLKTVKLNFTGPFCGKFSFRTPCWAHSWILTHINWYFLMAQRFFIHNSRRNHFQSIFPQFGTQFVTRISHFGNMDFSYSGFEQATFWTAVCLVEMSKYRWKSREILMSPGLPSALLRWEIWMKIQRNTYEPSPKLGEDFVPNWGKIEKRQLRLENQTKTRLSSSQELVFVCLFPMMCATPVVSMHFLREIWLES